MNFVTPKAAAERQLLFIKADLGAPITIILVLPYLVLS